MQRSAVAAVADMLLQLINRYVGGLRCTMHRSHLLLAGVLVVCLQVQNVTQWVLQLEWFQLSLGTAACNLKSDPLNPLLGSCINQQHSDHCFWGGRCNIKCTLVTFAYFL